MTSSTPVVVITGAAGSLGKAVAAAFLAQGTRVAALDISEAALATAYPGPADAIVAVAADLTDPASAQQAMSRVRNHFGHIDALCNIAGGFTMGTPVHSTPAADWKKMWEINAATLLNAVQAIVPVMLEQGGGKIVNVGAGAGQKGTALMGAYSVAKSAVIRLTEVMSAELREQNINVNCILPGIIDTPPNRAAMPDGDPRRWVAPGDLANVIVFLCSNAARAIHGAAIPVVGLS